MCDGEVGGAELRPAFRNHLRAGQQPFDREREVLGGVAAVAVVRMQMRDLADMRPGLRRADRRRDAVRRLDVGEAEGVFRIGNGLVEQEVGAAVHEHGQQREFLGHRAERRGVAARDDAGEQVDLAFELHPPQFFDVGVGAGGFVGGDGLDLALAQESALGIDLLGRHGVALQRRITEHRGGAGEEGHVAGLVTACPGSCLWPARSRP